MLVVLPQTREEKIAMFMKMPKRELIEMLLNNQELVARSLFPNNQAPSWSQRP